MFVQFNVESSVIEPIEIPSTFAKKEKTPTRLATTVRLTVTVKWLSRDRPAMSVLERYSVYRHVDKEKIDRLSC